MDFLLHLSSRTRAGAEPEGEADSGQLPEHFRKFEGLELSAVQNMAPVGHSRLGLRNDANVCYVNVVFQSLLPCSALMWFLRRCGEGDPRRPFLSCLVSLCKEPPGHRHVQRASARANKQKQRLELGGM